MKKRLRVLVLMHPDFMPPDSLEGYPEKEIHRWKTEYDVVTTLRASGHDVRAIGVQHELKPIRDEVTRWKPDVVFNLLEQFHGDTTYDQNVASYLELLRVPYTGSNPRGMMLARGKALSKKLLSYHRIPVPAFAVYPVGRRVKRPTRLQYPLIVKSLSEDSSLGISQASVVDSEERLVERVQFMHAHFGTDAIVEQYIEGRELYVALFGGARLQALPVWELEFGDLRAGQLPIATERVKHDPDYQERRGILQGPAEGLAPEFEERLKQTARRICHILEIDGYARVDFRLARDGTPYFLEANPNPEIASSEEFAQAALHAGIPYPALLNRLLKLAIQRAARRHG
ncbi:MAG: ATP-grasp domain-containing protein [Gammaproteobacteria bacterium]